MAKFVGYKKATIKKLQSMFATFSWWEENIKLTTNYAHVISCRQTKNSCEDRNSPCPKLKNCTSVQHVQENLQMNELQYLYDSVTNEHIELQKKV